MQRICFRHLKVSRFHRVFVWNWKKGGEEYGAIFSSFEFGKHFMLASDNLDKFKVLPDWQLTPTSTAPFLLSKPEG